MTFGKSLNIRFIYSINEKIVLFSRNKHWLLLKGHFYEEPFFTFPAFKLWDYSKFNQCIVAQHLSLNSFDFSPLYMTPRPSNLKVFFGRKKEHSSIWWTKKNSKRLHDVCNYDSIAFYICPSLRGTLSESSCSHPKLSENSDDSFFIWFIITFTGFIYTLYIYLFLESILLLQHRITAKSPISTSHHDREWKALCIYFQFLCASFIFLFEPWKI